MVAPVPSPARRVLLPVVVGVALLLAAAAPARADVPAYRVDCGPVTCSTYLSRPATATVARRLARYENASNAAVGVAAATACAASGIGGVAAAACGGIGSLYGAYAVDQFLAAAQAGSCVRMRYPHVPDGFPLLPRGTQERLPSLGWTVGVDASGFCAG